MSQHETMLQVRRPAGAGRPWIVGAAAALAALAAATRRPWLVGVAALAGLVASRPPKQSSVRERPRGSVDRQDAVRRLDSEVTVTSMGYPAPPTVTVGPATTPS